MIILRLKYLYEHWEQESGGSLCYQLHYAILKSELDITVFIIRNQTFPKVGLCLPPCIPSDLLRLEAPRWPHHSRLFAASAGPLSSTVDWFWEERSGSEIRNRSTRDGACGQQDQGNSFLSLVPHTAPSPRRPASRWLISYAAFSPTFQ